MLGYHEICGSDISAFLDEESTATSIFTRLADGEDIPIRFLAEITYVDIAYSAGQWEMLGEIASLAIAEDAEENAGASTPAQFLYSDGGWAGKPSDVARPNTYYEDRLLTPAAIQRSIPLIPEFPRRAATSAGDVRANGADGELDSQVRTVSISGRTIRVFVGPKNGDFVDFAQILEVLGDNITADSSTVSFNVLPSSSLLDAPLQTITYSGGGGITGDAGLAGRLRPLIFGQCFNVTPVLVNFDALIYQVHTGQVFAFDAIKDRGVPLTWNTFDYADYTTLRAAAVAPGEYATAKAIGMFKLGVEPAGIVTADVRGDVHLGSYTDETGAILQRLAIGNALLDASQLDLSGYNVLPKDPIGFYADGSNDYLVSDVYDLLLRPFNGWYGQRNDARLAIGLIDPPEAELPAWTLSEDDIIDIREEPVEVAPRYSQAISYARNWTPMDLSDLALGNPALTIAAIDALTNERSWYREVDASVQQRHSGAQKGPDIEGYFATITGAQVAARDRIMALLKQARQILTIRTKLQGLIIDINSTGTITHPRFGAEAGVPATAVSISIDAGRSEVEIGAII